ncbi:manganese catalase family protein [Desulfosporosinus acidiphilus]|uniref:manganese catalase family protein n=1 Tax=Desulfosporosinus acidiphilus TaxID=885581 RepID=UPI001FA7A25E|nr:manganese catalase family protein [Desulfosporosinus acidiphilus]
MELIAAAITKLGGPPLTCVNSQGAPWVSTYIDQSTDYLTMLQVDIQAETRAALLFQQHLESTTDPHMKKMINFLITREEYINVCSKRH